MNEFSHLDNQGNVRMVDITNKQITLKVSFLKTNPTLLLNFSWIVVDYKYEQ